jgi:hypothetical protein
MLDQNFSNNPIIVGKCPYGCVHPGRGPVNSRGAVAYFCPSFFHVCGVNLVASGANLAASGANLAASGANLAASGSFVLFFPCHATPMRTGLLSPEPRAVPDPLPL